MSDDPLLDKENVCNPTKSEARSLKNALKSKSPEKSNLNADLQVQYELPDEQEEKEAVQDELMNVEEPEQVE